MTTTATTARATATSIRARRAGLAAAATCAALLLVLVAGEVLFPIGEGTTPVDLVWIASLLTYPVVGTIVVARHPHHRLGWVYLAVGIAFTLALCLASAADVLASRGSPAADAVQSASLVPYGVVWALISTVAILLFPDGHLPGPRWRPVAWAAWAGVGATALVAFAPGLETPVLLVLGLVTLACLVSLVARWRAGDTDARRRLSWMLLAVVVIVVAAGVGAVNAALEGPYPVGVAAEATAQAAIPVLTGVAIIRSGLFDIEVVVDRALVYVALTAAVLGTYAAVVTLSTQAVGDAAGQAAGLLAAVAVAVTSGPLTHRLVAAVDRRLFGQRSSPYTVLRHVARDTSGAEHVDDLLEGAARTVARDLRLPFVQIVPEPAASEHREHRPSLVVDVTHRDRREGVLVVGLRRGQRRFTPREAELLEDLAGQLAVTMRAVRLAEELQQSRERIVRAREDERQRIRRDLHDGVGPVLAAAGLHADTLRDHLDPGDTEGRAILDRMAASLRRGVGDVRRTVEGLRPPALDQLGLAAVVVEHTAALDGTDGLRCSTDVQGDVSAPAAVEVAAYRIVLEATTNVVRHAGARQCTVRIQHVDDTLVVEVVDDGRGLLDPTGPHRGVGLGSMRERAEELGGRLVVTVPPGGGTLVRAVLPVWEHRR